MRGLSPGGGVTLARPDYETEGRTVEATRDPNRWKALAVLGIAYLMVVLDVSVVNVALFDIQTDLNFSPSDLQWVVSAYALTFGGFLLLGGRAGDILGRRRVFLAGLALFVVFSLMCGLAQNSGMLIAARVLQGLAAAVLSPSVFSIASVTFEEGPERNKALGVLGGIAGAGAAIGVLVGGIFTEYAGWEWVFYINAPIGVIAFFLALKFVRESRGGDAKNFDAAGAFTITAALMILVYALTQAQEVGWGSLQTVGLLALSVALHGVFLLIESRTKHPLVRLGFFKKRTPTGANVIGFLLGTMVFGMFLLLSLYMRQVLEFSALKTGIAYLAVALMAIVASGVAQALVTKAGVKPILAIGMIMQGAGLIYFTQISPDGTYVGDLLPGFLLTGVGLGFSFVPVSIAALGGVDPHEAGLASGLINTSQQIGGALGVAILTTVSTTHTSTLIEDGVADPSALSQGWSLAFWVAAGFALAGLVATMVLLRNDDLQAVPAAVPVG
jgi:EmrB/QacA subfamily drug resistance transporter